MTGLEAVRLCFATMINMRRNAHRLLTPYEYFSRMGFDMNPLPDLIKEIIAEMPEYSYGVNKVTVELDDGCKYDEVFVGWGEEILKVGTSLIIPFDPSRVVKVVNAP